MPMLLHSSAVDFVRAVSGTVQSWSARPRFMALAIRLSLYAVCFHRSILLPQTTRTLTRARHPENLCSYTSNHVHLDSTLGHTCDHRPYGLIAVRTIIGSHARDANHESWLWLQISKAGFQPYAQITISPCRLPMHASAAGLLTVYASSSTIFSESCELRTNSRFAGTT